MSPFALTILTLTSKLIQLFISFTRLDGFPSRGPAGTSGDGAWGGKCNGKKLVQRILIHHPP